MSVDGTTGPLDIIERDPLEGYPEGLRRMIGLYPAIVGWANGTWYQRRAYAAVCRGDYDPIMSRDGLSLYMLRTWLSKAIRNEKDKILAEDSVLLHFIRRPDDDLSLHDHPWDFVSDLICGGYTEEYPPPSWPGKIAGLGPPFKSNYQNPPAYRSEGEQIEHKAADLHRIASIQPPNGSGKPPEVWTMVTTGKEIRTWGFHAEGQIWRSRVDYFKWLDSQATKATP